ncbi:hypothetical protein IFM89_035229 [Coptis chinensis]|uniref:RanBD1 domain-containing protein n=1 Tax=Coptis chinensis TaxID=261450 RepID=A0A835IE65_9MAGN|nr:hypothetical protein IFM89_035229 [Coptis chinensis]
MVFQVVQDFWLWSLLQSFSMADAQNVVPPSKKRAAGREISRDNPGLDDDEDVPEQETGTFKKASEEVLATRRIVKVRRQQTPASASSNPFANLCFVPHTESTGIVSEVQPVAGVPALRKVDEKAEEDIKEDIKTETVPGVNETGVTETDEKDTLEANSDNFEAESANKEKSDGVEKTSNPEDTSEKGVAGGEGEGQEAKEDNGHGDASPSAPLNSFQQLSSNQNAFTGIAGTGFSTSTFSFGSLAKDGSAFGAGAGSGSSSLFGQKNDNPSFPSFNFGKSNNGSSSLFGTAGASDAAKSEGSGLPSMQEVPVETGEENEKAVFTADAVLFEYLDGGWKERGKGELKVNVSTTGVERARLVMRARGIYRLILNACLYPDMKLTSMDKRGITFACMNSTGEGKDGLTTFALKFKDGSIVEEFCTAVTLHKGQKSGVLKTPENSPKASED